MCLKCDLRDKDRRHCLGGPSLVLVLGSNAEQTLDMFKQQCKAELYPVLLPQSLTLGKLRVTLSIFRGSAFLLVETRYRDSIGVYLGFGCKLQRGACPERTP